MAPQERLGVQKEVLLRIHRCKFSSSIACLQQTSPFLQKRQTPKRTHICEVRPFTHSPLSDVEQSSPPGVSDSFCCLPDQSKVYVFHAELIVSKRESKVRCLRISYKKQAWDLIRVISSWLLDSSAIRFNFLDQLKTGE